MKMLDLFCGRWGWGRAFAERGWEVVGVDLTEPPEIPEGCTFIKADVLTLTPEWVRAQGFDFICASSPCEQFSVHRMKMFHPDPAYPRLGAELFNHTRWLCEVSGTSYIMENVRTAQEFVGQAVALADAEAAESLNAWMAALKRVEAVYEVSYGQRLVIIRHFEERSLWQYLIDPETDQTFPSMTAWLSSGFIGCRRVNFEALRTGKALADVPAGKLLDIPKGSLHTLAQLSTAVRNEPEVLEAARTMKPEEFEEKLEREHPLQHVERRTPMRLTPGRSERRIIDRWIEYAIAHDVAGSPTEAIVKACERCLLDEELNELHPVPDEVTA
jgi:hypothetical protein